MLSVFANFRIDSHERYLRMCDSFHSFKESNINRWVINVRGSFKEQAVDFLKREILAERLYIFTLESSTGWAHDSAQMLNHIPGPYVLFWIEDHILMASPKKLDAVVADMQLTDAAYLEYSWFGGGALIKGFEGCNLKPYANVYSCYFDKISNNLRQAYYRQNYGDGVYIISVASIFEKSLFCKLITKRKPLYRRWSKYTPFNFEKRWDDTAWLPLKIAVPKQELFACIDDDNLYPGDSLVARGMYPLRVPREDLLLYRSPVHVRRMKEALSKHPKLFCVARVLYQFIKRIKYQF